MGLGSTARSMEWLRAGLASEYELLFPLSSRFACVQIESHVHNVYDGGPPRTGITFWRAAPCSAGFPCRVGVLEPVCIVQLPALLGEAACGFSGILETISLCVPIS